MITKVKNIIHNNFKNWINNLLVIINKYKNKFVDLNSSY